MIDPGRQQHDVPGVELARRLSGDAQPAGAGGDSMEGGAGRRRHAQSPWRLGTHVRHQRAANAQQIQNVVERAAIVHARCRPELLAEFPRVMQSDKKSTLSVIHRLRRRT
jgi:hypothetical protein